MPKISLCVICRDEEELLPGCLESAGPAVDEIIVIDTGSTDDSRKVARDHGATVITAAWTDFSTARNQALHRATGDWILTIDADEELVLENPDTLRELASADEADAYAIRIINVMELAEFVDTEKSPQFHTVRFFKHQGALYQNPVHERLLLPPGVRFARATGIDIIHYGFLPEFYNKKQKDERNSELMQVWIDAEPDNPWALFYMGRQLQQDGQPTQAVEFYAQALPGLVAQGEHATVIDTYKSLGDCFSRAPGNDRAGRLLAQGILTYPSSIDLRYVYGTFLLDDDNAQAAAEQFFECIELTGTDTAHRASLSPIWERLAQSFDKLNEPDRAGIARAMAGDTDAVASEAAGKELLARIRDGDDVDREVYDYLRSD